MKDKNNDRYRKMQILGHRVCQPAYCKLLGIDRARFQRLSLAVREGQTACPLDGRFIKAPHSKKPSKLRSTIYDFLSGLYHKIAEPLPDGRAHVGKRPRLDRKQDDQGDRRDLRHLPPGTFTDYLRLYNVEHPHCRVKLKTFMKVPCHYLKSLLFCRADMLQHACSLGLGLVGKFRSGNSVCLIFGYAATAIMSNAIPAFDINCC